MATEEYRKRTSSEDHSIYFAQCIPDRNARENSRLIKVMPHEILTLRRGASDPKTQCYVSASIFLAPERKSVIPANECFSNILDAMKKAGQRLIEVRTKTGSFIKINAGRVADFYPRRIFGIACKSQTIIRFNCGHKIYKIKVYEPVDQVRARLLAAQTKTRPVPGPVPSR